MDSKLYEINIKVLGDSNIENIYFDLLKELSLKGLNVIEDDIEALEYRVCDECGCIMTEGYVLEGGFGYWCSDECLENDVTMTEQERSYLKEEGELYYTEWN